MSATTSSVELLPTSGVILVALTAAILVLRETIRLARARTQMRRERFELVEQELEHELKMRRLRRELDRDEVKGFGPRPTEPLPRAQAAAVEGAVFEQAVDAIAEVQLRLAWEEVPVASELVELPRYIPISIYADTTDPAAYYAIRDAIERLLGEFGFVIVSEGRLEDGSLFQRMTAKLKDPATKAEVKRQATLAHLALQQETLGRAQADINAKQAEAAREVHKILSGHDRYVIVIGSLVGVTERSIDGRRNSMIVELTPDELAAFYREGDALKNVSRAFELLAAMKPDEAARQLDHRALPEMTGSETQELPDQDEPRALPPGTDS
jgi:hypothetical protein